MQRFVWEFNEHVIKNGIGNKNTIKMPYLVSLLCYLYLLGELGHFGAIPESLVSIKREKSVKSYYKLPAYHKDT